MLAGPLPAWDRERRRVDVAPLVAWLRVAARGAGLAREMTAALEATPLEAWHRAGLDADAALVLSRHLTLHSRGAAARAALHALLRAALPELPWADVVVQAAATVRVLVPGRASVATPLHTDHAIGHALDERNVWVALTPARGSAALRALPLAASLDVERARRARGVVALDALDAPAARAALEEVEALEVDAGDVLLFTPVHVHGARTIVEDATRVSLDVRIAPAAAPRAGAHISFIAVQP